MDVQESASGGALQQIGKGDTDEALDNLDDLFKDLLDVFKKGLQIFDGNFRREAA